jgi:hypothetical protein
MKTLKMKVMSLPKLNLMKNMKLTMAAKRDSQV